VTVPVTKRRIEAASTRHTEVPVEAIVATNPAAEAAGIHARERPEPTPAINDVVVEVHASGFVPADLGVALDMGRGGKLKSPARRAVIAGSGP
jgi:NADPH:quinone reductase-like Zn-dependent oxidoreductase